MDSQLKAELEEDRRQLMLAYLESADPGDREIVELIEFLLQLENCHGPIA